MSSVTVPLQVELTGPLAELAEIDAAADIAEAVRIEVSRLLGALGLPDAVEASVRAGVPGRSAYQVARIRVWGRPCSYSRECLHWACAHVDGRQEDVRTLEEVTAWLKAGGATGPRQRATDLVAVLAAEAIKLRPSVLLDDALVEGYARGLKLEPPALDVGWLSAVLGPVLDLQIGLAATARVAEVLREHRDEEAAVTAEALAETLAAGSVQIVVPERLAQRMVGDQNGSAGDRLVEMQRLIYEELGVVVPAIVRGSADAVPPDMIAMRINDVWGLSWPAPADDEYFASAKVAELQELDVVCRVALNPRTGRSGAFVDAVGRDRLAGVGYGAADSTEYTLQWLYDGLLRRAGCFVQVGKTRAQIARFESTFPLLVNGARSRIADAEFATAARSLVAEQVSIRDLRTVLERVVDIPDGADPVAQRLQDDPAGWRGPAAGAPGPAPESVSAFLRMGLRRQIASQWGQGTSTVAVYLLDPTFDDLLQPVEGAASGDPTDLEDVLTEALENELQDLGSGQVSPALLVTDDVREHVQRTLRRTMPRIAVLGYGEIPASWNILPVARINSL